MTILHRPEPPGAAIDKTDEIFANAITLAFGQSRRPPVSERVANGVFWLCVLAVMGWLFAMSIDREVPVSFSVREVVNPDRQVAQGAQLQVRSTRRRTRQCELVRRWYVIDGGGRRHDYEAQRFDAYGPLTPPGQEGDTEINGPVIPLDAMPGHGRWVSTLAWDCNILQRALGWSITVVQAPIDFEIVLRQDRH